MAAKKKTRKLPQKKSKKPTAKQKDPTRKSARKKPELKKKIVAKKTAKKKSAVKAKSTSNKAVAAKTVSQPKKPVRRSGQVINTVDHTDEGLGARSGGQSGDLQGLSGFEGPDSESVDELIEEGNSFEAGVIKGVEDAGDQEGQEVHTHEVPEDDVPEEYLDEK
jgi:hypothetical protein